MPATRAFVTLRRAGFWLTAGQFALAAHRRWGELPEEHRKRAQALIAKSRGNPKRLSAAERRELGRALRRLKLPALIGGSASDVARGRTAK